MKASLILVMCLLTALDLFAQDSVAYKTTISNNTFVYSGNTIKIFSGQRISISAINTNGRLENLTLLDTGISRIESANFVNVMIRQNAEKDICIDFNVVRQEDGKFNTYLIVNNPFKKNLRYKAKIFSTRINDYEETSIWDVEPGISGVEHWPYSISDIILYDFVIKK